MTDIDILRQIALLNPKIINGNEVDSMNNLILSSGSSSPQGENQNDSLDIHDDNDILNLWSSTKIFFDPFDPSKINPTTQSQNNVNINSPTFTTDGVNKLSEREIDRQRYNRLKKQQQSIYINRGRNGREDNVAKSTTTDNTNNNNITINNNNNSNNMLNIHDIHQLLLNDNNNNNGLLQAITTSNTTPQTITSTQHLIHNINNTLNNDINNQPISIDKMGPNDEDKIGTKKGKDLYTQLLDSVNSNKRKNIKETETDAILSKTNESRNKEIVDKKKRRSAATMRCRERKKNQLQKKEQYIKYLENQILFLNGSILHMSNEITWLRKSFLDQYGEQSLKNIYMKNGFKNVNFNNILYPNGSTPSPSSFGTSNLLSPEMSINNSPISQISHSPELLEKPNLTFEPQASSTIGPTTSHALLSNFSPVTNDTHLDRNNSLKTSSATASTNQTHALTNGDASSGSNYLSSYSAPTSIIAHPSTTSTEQNDLFKHLDMETLNEFANLSKEQREVLLKILEKQQELSTPSSPKITSTVTPSPVTTPASAPHSSTKNYMNIANDLDNNDISKPPNSLLNLASTATTNAHQFNLLSLDNPQHELDSLTFHSTTQPSITTSSLSTSTNNALTMTTTASELTNIIPTTTTASSNDYINLENLIYYI